MIIIIFLKLNSRVDLGLGPGHMQVKLTINPSQYKDKNNYYNSFKNSGVAPGLGLGHKLG